MKTVLVLHSANRSDFSGRGVKGGSGRTGRRTRLTQEPFSFRPLGRKMGLENPPSLHTLIFPACPTSERACMERGDFARAWLSTAPSRFAGMETAPERTSTMFRFVKFYYAIALSHLCTDALNIQYSRDLSFYINQVPALTFVKEFPVLERTVIMLFFVLYSNQGHWVHYSASK